MFHPLTKYLFLYRQAAIPGIGSFQLVQQPATPDAAHEQIHPPLFKIDYTDKDTVHHHQIAFMVEELEMDEASIQDQLESFGKALRKHIQKEPFEWNGIGKLEFLESKIIFRERSELSNGLQPVMANMVKRENRQHKVLIGEREIHSHELQEMLQPLPVKKRNYTLLVGWIVVAVAVFFILFYLYRHGFSPLSTGANLKFTPADTVPAHK